MRRFTTEKDRPFVARALDAAGNHTDTPSLTVPR